MTGLRELNLKMFKTEQGFVAHISHTYKYTKYRKDDLKVFNIV